MALRHVGGVGGIIDEYVVPGFVLGWSAAGHLLVPLLAQIELGIDTYDDAPVAELAVFDELPDKE